MGKFVKAFDVYAKAAIKHSQIKTKLDIGCDGIELQMLDEIYRDGLHEWRDIEEVIDLSEFSSYPVRVVHAPLVPNRGDVLLERIADVDDFTVLDNVFKVANYFGVRQKRKVLVVFHSEMHLELMMDLGSLWHNIVKYLDHAFTTYSQVEFCLENVSPLRGIHRGGDLFLANNYAFDNVKVIKQLRKELQYNGFGTVLDTCHQMLAEKYITGLYEMTGEFKAPDLSLRHYFEMYEDTIKLMHICGMKGSGYGKGKHGTPFKEADKDILQNIVDLKLQYAPACPATLEVEETDFAVCDGYSSTLNTLQSCASFDVKEYLEEHFPNHWMDIPPASLANLRTQEDCDKLIKELEG